MVYYYDLEMYVESDKTILRSELEKDPNWAQVLATEYENHWIAEFSANLMNEKGIGVIQGNMIKVSAQAVDVDPHRVRLDAYIKFHVETDQPIHDEHSPIAIPSWLIQKIFWTAFSVILISYVVVRVLDIIADVMHSFTTRTTTMTLHHGDPSDPEYCKTETTTKEEPDPLAQTLIWIGGIIILLIVVTRILPVYLPPRKRKK